MHRVDLQCNVLDVLNRWPRGYALGAMIAADGYARYSVLGIPVSVSHNLDDVFAVRSVVNADPGTEISDPCAGSQERNSTYKADTTHRVPFNKGWIVSFAYETGIGLSAAGMQHNFYRNGKHTGSKHGVYQHNSREIDSLPQVIAARIEGALVYDHRLRMWYVTGDWVEAELKLVLDACRQNTRCENSYVASEFVPLIAKEFYQESVTATLGYIYSGDIYQANITHPLCAEFQGCALTWFAARCGAASPRYACYIQCRDGIITSFSPELLLHYDAASRRLTTRPMKGTRPDIGGAYADLTRSEKDRAELAMIVDLLRNDLGRVCELGSVQVESARDIEAHDSLLQTTATITGTLGAHRSLRDAWESCFPGGSVTGAPKSRAMQIISELEYYPRGHYCGCAGYIADGGDAQLNITIRTGQLIAKDPLSTAHPHECPKGTAVVYGVGAGIVADSLPPEEWAETLAKAAPLYAKQGRQRSMIS